MAGLWDESDSVHVDFFRSYLGIEGNRVLALYGREWNSVQEILAKLDKHYVPTVSVPRRRGEFIDMRQKRTTLEDFARQVEEKGRRCHLGSEEERLIRDKFINGVTKEVVYKALMEKAPTTLSDALMIARDYDSRDIWRNQVSRGGR